MSALKLSGQKGQAVTEAILIMVLLFAISAAVGAYFKQNEVFRQIITGPFQSLAGMLQNGIWAPPNVGAEAHPNAHGRHIVISGEEGR